VTRFDWSGKAHQIADEIPDLAVLDDLLQVRIRMNSDQFGLQLRSAIGEIAGDLDDKTRMVGRHVGRGNSRLGVNHFEVTLSASEWALLRDPIPSIWVGRLEGRVSTTDLGNMIVGTGSDFGRRHCRLLGNFKYYIAWSPRQGDAEQETWLVVDVSSPSMPSRDLLRRDLLGLAFCMGTQLRLRSLVGVSDDLTVTSMMSGVRETAPYASIMAPPTPGGRESWYPVFFERLSRAWRDDGDSPRFSLACQMYTDALLNNLDTDYLKLQVALEAFAFWTLKQTEKSRRKQNSIRIVKDQGAWEKWITELSPAIREHAEAGFEDRLVAQVKSALFLGAGDIVPQAFRSQGLELTEELQKELKARNVVVHQGLIAPKGYDIKRELRRIRLVRTMLVALVAKACGYAGAINGWTLDDNQVPLEPDDGWWKVGEEERKAAQKTFYAHEPSQLEA
jgi:hypothetical protein